MRPRLLAGALLVGFALAAALLSLVWTPFPTDTVSIAERLRPPSALHLLGTDALGRDVLSLVMAGARTSIAVALASTLLGAAAGVPLGLSAAVRGGWPAELVLRGTDLLFAFPSLVTAILLAAAFGPSAAGAVVAIAVFNVPVFARVARGGALQLMSLDYIRAAELAGKGRARIAAEHVAPNVAGLLAVQATVQAAVGILAEAALSFVGLGAQPPVPSWGRMLAEAQTMLALAPHLVLVPGAAIVLTVLGLGLMGDGARDLLDPRR